MTALRVDMIFHGNVGFFPAGDQAETGEQYAKA
jgi:hypothetical protein